jgi:hypothetical protein
MIWIVLLALLILALVGWDVYYTARHDREREAMRRHVDGKPWWGER